MAAPGAETSDLFYSDLIAQFANAHDAVSRYWLLDEVTARLAQPDCRFVLLTGEPGVGKTGVMTALAAAHPDWLRYFARADSIRRRSADDAVSLFLRIGHQLAQSQPDLFDPKLLEAVVVQMIGNVAQGGTATGIKIEDLTVSPFRQTALRVQQNVGTLAGDVVGIEIARANLEPRMLQPSMLAELALFGPAALLASKRPDQTIVVQIDGLDEAIASREVSTMLDWLGGFPKAPSNVKFVMSSRPHPRLRTLQGVREGTLHTLAIESFSSQVRDDTRAFAERLFGATRVFVDKPPSARDAAIAALSTAAQGNFAYLTAYSRSLRAAVQSGNSGMLEELLKFDSLPPGLLPLYAVFRRRVRRQVEFLGRLPAPSSETNERVPAWEGVGQRILATLSVAFAPLSVDQIAALGEIRAWKDDIKNVFQHFVPLLDESRTGWQFFHPSLAEFLRDENDDSLSDVTVDRRQWDSRIVLHYTKGSEWPEVHWQDVDDYGLLNISRHLARDGGSRAVFPVLSRRLRLAMHDRFLTDLPFRRVVEQARPNPGSESDIGRLLADTVFLEMVLSGLNDRAEQLEPAVYGLMARLGRVDEALARANVLQPGFQLYRSLEAIVACTPAELRASLGPLDGVEMLVSAALGVPQSGGSGLFAGMNRSRCLSDAAEKMAAHDLERAIGLVDLAEKDHGERDKIIARAIKAAPHRAQELLPRMAHGRSKAALDAAEDLSDQAAALSAVALAEITGEEVADQWRILARIFALTKGTNRGIVERLEREISEAVRKYPQRNDDEESNDDDQSEEDHARHTAEPEAREPDRWRYAVVDVAERIYPFAPDAAQRILALPEPEVAKFASADTLVSAAKLWIAWGRPVDGRRSLEKALVHYRGLNWYGPANDIARIAITCEPMDPPWSQELADEAMGLLAPVVKTASGFERGRLDSVLSNTFDVLRRWDRVRALKVARWMTDGWISGGDWDSGGRGSAIALMGLDAAGDPSGNSGDLLKECIAKESERVRFGRAEVAVTDFGLFSPSQESPADSEDMMRTVNFITFVANQMNYWGGGREWRYFEDPAEVLRSMDYPFPSCASWARSLVASITPLAKKDIDLATAVASWLGDPAERMVALAALTAELLARDHLHASAALAALQAADRNLPLYSPKIDLEKMEGHDILLYLNPSIRARFESAVYLLRAGSSVSFELIDNTSPYIQGIHHAQSLFEHLSAMPPGAPDSHYDELEGRISGWDPLVGDLVKLAAVAALVPQDVAAAREKAAHLQNETLRGGALLHCVDGTGTATRCISILDGMKPESIAWHGGQLAALGMRICSAAGVSSRPVLERGLAALESSDQLFLAHGLAALADATNDSERSDLLVRAIRAADGAGNGYLRPAALVRIFSSAVKAKDGALVAQLASRLTRDGWRSIMAALAYSMARLIEMAGPGVVEELDAAMRRAQTLFDAGPEPQGQAAHLDGVIAPHQRPPNPPAALYEVPQLTPEFLATFLDKADISPTIARSRDSRNAGMEPDDALFEQLHGRHAGFSFWMDGQEKVLGQLFDIRFYFNTTADAREYFEQKLEFLSESDPEVEDAPKVGEDCFVFGGECDRTLQGQTIRMTNYCYVFRIDLFVVKLYAAQGVVASEKLTPVHVFRLAEIVKGKIKRSTPVGTCSGT